MYSFVYPTVDTLSLEGKPNNCFIFSTAVITQRVENATKGNKNQYITIQADAGKTQQSSQSFANVSEPCRVYQRIPR